MKELFIKIGDWFVDIYKSIRNIYWQVENGISNLVNYFPLIWKDRNYDYVYMYDMLEFKISRMRDRFKVQQIFVGWERQVERMDLILSLMAKVRSEFYEGECLTYTSTFRTPRPPKDGVYVYLKKYQRQYRYYVDIKGETDLDRIARLISYDNQKRAKRILFQLIHNNIDSWWD